jgi:hypothetical protein
MNLSHGLREPPPARTAYVLDDVWPEYASYVDAVRREEDQLLAPGLWRKTPKRYAWPGKVGRPARLATAKRHFDTHRVAKAPGGVRQRTYFEGDRLLAYTLARSIDYRAGHMVVAQAWLPWLDETGALGGRSFDVLMSRYPLAELHRRLDQAGAELGKSATIRDFRAPDELVAREAALLARARKIITPHHNVAALFGDRALLLAWHRPPAAARQLGNRVAFIGPTIARQRPDLARKLAGDLDQPLIVLGEMIESQWWSGMPIERRAFGAGWLDGIGTILHPATITNQPRRLLEALSAGVRIRATDGCGLHPGDFEAIS